MRRLINGGVAGAPNLFTLATGGILVAAVDPSSSAAAAGLAPGDVVTGISGSDISVMPHADALRVLQVLCCRNSRHFLPLMRAVAECRFICKVASGCFSGLCAA